MEQLFTVIYSKKDGYVQSITSGTYSDEDFIEAYGDEVDRIEVNSLPSAQPYRQYLAVKNKELVVVTEELTPEKERFVRQMEIADEMNTLKNYLTETDYTVIKCSELGLDFATTYPEVSAERAKARTRINELEEELKTVEMTV